MTQCHLSRTEIAQLRTAVRENKDVFLLSKRRIQGGMSTIVVGTFRNGKSGIETLACQKKPWTNNATPLQGAQQALLREIKIMERLEGNPYVPQVLFADPHGTQLILEFIATETLMQALQRSNGIFDWKRAIGVLKNVATALGSIHSRGVLHLDLKPPNLLTGIATYLIDFGSGEIVTQTGIYHREHADTTGYIAAPEQLDHLKDRPGYYQLSQQTDIYQLGVLLYEMLTGKNPFPGETEEQVALAKLTGRHKPLPESTPSHVVKVYERCIAKDAFYRYPNCGSLLNALSQIDTSRNNEGINSGGVPLTPPLNLVTPGGIESSWGTLFV